MALTDELTRYALAGLCLIAAVAVMVLAPIIAHRYADQWAIRLVFWLGRGRDVRISSGIPLITLKDARYHLRQEMYLTVEQDKKGVFTVSSRCTRAYGVGSTLADAVENFEAMLVDRFESFSRDEDVLSDLGEYELASMRRFIAAKESR